MNNKNKRMKIITVILPALTIISCENNTAHNETDNNLTDTSLLKNDIIIKQDISETYKKGPIECFQKLTDTMDEMDWIADTNRLKEVTIYNLNSSKIHKYNNKPFYIIDLAEHQIFTWENSAFHLADTVNYSLFKKAKSIWAYFYRNKSDKITIRDGVIEQWEFEDETTAELALQNLEEVYPLPYFNTQPYYHQVKNYLFIFNTRASAFSYSQKEIYEIFKNIKKNK